MKETDFDQMTLWGEMFPYYHIQNKLRIIELFAGIGSQLRSAEVLFKQQDSSQPNPYYESWKICEWAYNSYCAYNSIHIKDFKDYSEGKTKEELIAKVLGTSTDYNNPLSMDQLNKKSMDWLKSAYNNVVATKNLINIMNVHGEDLEIVDTDKYTYLLTYSFPCQDISAAGLGRSLGVSQAQNENQSTIGEGTRSGLLWEVERILTELKAKGDKHLPQILVMENVELLLSKKHLPHFKKWIHRLEQLGYSNYCDMLNGVNYGIPQARKRIFCISILGQYAYDFPRKVPKKYKLKDFLEKNVDKKYYLTQEQIERISKWNAQQKPLESIPKHIEVCPTITARGAGEDHSGMILIDEDLIESGIPIKNNTSKGYTIAEVGDGVDISGRMEWHRGTVQKGQAQTLTTKGGENVGVVVDEEPSLFTECDIALITPEGDIRRYIGSDIIDKFEEGQMASTSYPNGYGHGTRTHNDSITLTKGERPIVKQNLRIRKLTELECYKLMGFTRKNFYNMERNKFSASDLYSMAGDSIIVCCLIALLCPLIYGQDDHIKIINDYVDEIVKGE